ncbi:MAG: multi-sensor signal transduction histidine kinase [Elusimicrobia bacterium]|nr:MAG: multi-sensor signal transduction histidine kinase [Elusimicrobiota bacterium]
MVVDDDRDCLQVVVASLRDYEVLPLSEGTGLAARAQEFAPDVLILDVQLKETDGFTLCRDLKGRRATSSIPVIFLSGLTASEDFLAAFGAGGAVYLTKPLDPDDLRRIIDDLLRKAPSDGSEPA